MISSLTLTVLLTPCGILRNNLWNSGAYSPDQIMNIVAYCISNYEQRNTVVLTDREEIEEFRERSYVAQPKMVEKPDARK